MEQTSVSSTDLRKYLLACENGDQQWVDKALESGIVQVIITDYNARQFGNLVCVYTNITSDNVLIGILLPEYRDFIHKGG